MMRRLKKRISIKILFWFILVNALTIAGVTFLVYQNMSRKHIADELQELASIRDLAAENLLGETGEFIDLAATVARTPLLAEILAGWTIPESGSTYFRDILSIHKEGSEFDFAFIHLVDVSGTIIASSDPLPVGKKIGGRRYFQAALQGASGLAGPYQSKVFKDIRHVIAYAPVKMNGQVTGVVMIPIDLEQLTEILVSPGARIGQSGETYLVGMERPPQLDEVELDTYKKIITKPRFVENSDQDIEIDTEAVRECLKGASGVKIIKDYRGVAVLSAYAPLKGLGWAIISEIDEAEALAGLRRLRNIIILFGIGCLGVVSFVSVLVARSISRPIHQLRVGSERVGAGDLGFQIEIKTGDEIEQLADGFNRMSAKLRESYSDLEGRVEERTRALGESERRLRSILAAAKNVSFITTDLEGTEAHILGFSPGAENIFGYSREEVIGKPVAMLHLPEDVDRLPEVHESLRQKKEGFSREATLIQKNGEGFPAFFVTYPLLDAKGDVNSALDVSIDITERKRAEEELRSSEERLKILFEYAPEGYYLSDLRGNFIDGNRAAEKIIGYEKNELIGKNFLKLKLLPLKQLPRAIKLLAQNVRGRSTGPDEFTLTRRDGSRVPVEIFTHPVKIKGQTLALANVHDMTERKRAQEEIVQAKEQAEKLAHQAEAASKAKSEFLASMSHEIRTPMNAILGMADLLSETPLNPEQEKFVQVFRSAGESLLILINDILDLSKVEAGQLALEETSFDLEEVVEKAHQGLAYRAHEKGLELVCSVNPEAPRRLIGDPARLRQVLTNLIGNAIKFTEKGEVVVEVSRRGEKEKEGEVGLLFSVRDTGIGIPPEKKEVIFEQFTQADSSTTRRYGGTGLGLTISGRMVELMGGRIWVESELGEGSTFYFTADFKTAAEKEEALVPEVELAGLRALIVDDNATNRMVLRETLSRWGASPSEAVGGAAGLAQMRRAGEAGQPFALVLLDQRMPEMDGFQVAEAIRQDSTISETTVIMLTSDLQKDGPNRAKELGISGYLVKPVKPSNLKEAIEVALGKRKAAAKERPDVAEPEELEPRSILLAEDNEDNRMLILSYLKKTPYQVDAAENGEAAVEKFRAGDYDLVLMDIQMPIMDGHEATREIRRWEAENKLEETPVITLTAHAMKEDTQKSLEAGCNDHLTKPIKKADLLAAIQKYV